MIDGHTHMLAGFKDDGDRAERAQPGWKLDLSDFIDMMDLLDVERIVTFAQDMKRIYKRWQGSNEDVIDLQTRFPDRVLGIIGAEPLDDRDLFNRERLEEVRCAATGHGIRGFCMTPAYGHYYANDRRVYPFYELAVELDIAVMFHYAGGVGGGGGKGWEAPIKYSRPVVLDDVVVDFPELRIYVEHLAYPWTEELFALMMHGPNVYTDISALLERPTVVAWYITMAKEYGLIERVVWGSDWDIFWFPPVDLESYARRVTRETDWIKTGLNENLERSGWPTLQAAEIDGILGENSRRFFRQ